ncbi:MAG: VTT domain-containing protein [Chloroflexi bacterium]|nr:VTT domain-containing protein [Chloroflexota bacterium]
MNGHGEKERWMSPTVSTFVMAGMIVVACIAPIAAQQFLSISPGLIGAVGIPMIVLLGFVGSITVVVPVPVLSLVFAGAAILNPVTLVIAAAASITAGMTVCYILGRRGHSRSARIASASRSNLPSPITSFYSWSAENVGTASFLIAATPNPVFDYAGFIAGAGRLSVRRFLAGTFAGKFAQASVIAFLGHTVGRQIFGFGL